MDKKEKLLKAALELIVDQGFHGTPTSQIAKRAGIASGTLFYFFPTKDALVIALYLKIKNEMSDYMKGAIENKGDFRDLLKGYYSATLNWAQANQTAFRFVEQFNSSPYLTEIADEEIQRHVKPMLDLLRRGINEGVLKPIDSEIMVSLISGHTFSINKYLTSRQLPVNRSRQIIDETFGLLWKMIT